MPDSLVYSQRKLNAWCNQWSWPHQGPTVQPAVRSLYNWAPILCPMVVQVACIVLLGSQYSCHPVLLIDWCRNVWRISSSDWVAELRRALKLNPFKRNFTLNHWWDSTRGSLSTLLVRALEWLIFWRKERSNKIEVGYRLHTSYLNTDFIHLFHMFMLFKCCLNVEIPFFLPLNLTSDEMRPVITGTIYQKFYTQFGPSELDIGILAQKEINCEGELLQSYTPCPRFVHARCTAGILEMGPTWPNTLILFGTACFNEARLSFVHEVCKTWSHAPEW